MITRLLAPNPSPLTGRGTNTYLVGDDRGLACIDPGPADEAHLAAIRAALDGAGAPLRTILLSHSHADHRPLAARLAAATGASVRALDPGRGDDGALALHDGERIAAGGLALEVVATPGHAADHVCLFEPDAGVLFSGDHVLQGMTTVVAPPDGDMQAYMTSLERVRSLRPCTILPGHGERVDDAGALIEEYLHHRREREAQVLAALRERGTAAPLDLVPGIYAAYPEVLWPWAAKSVEAHLEKLFAEGAVRRAEGDPQGFSVG